MALPMLVNGADCGPVNPLQGLSKQFDRDRGLQQDQFGAGRAGSSKEVFRSHYNATAGVDQDAARFFAANQAVSSTSPAPFDLSALHTNLPAAASHVRTPAVQSPPRLMSPPVAGSWATDFMQQIPAGAENPLAKQFLSQPQASQSPPIHQDAVASGGLQQAMPMQTNFISRMNSMPFQPYSPLGHATPQITNAPQHHDTFRWEEAFSNHEALSSVSETVVQDVAHQEQVPARTADDPDELARAAGSLIEAVRSEQNPKFKNSAFLGLMKQLRDREIVVEGDQMVPNEGVSAEGWAAEFQSKTDTKGKGKAVDHPFTQHFDRNATAPISTPSASEAFDASMSAEEEIDAYFRQENDNYIGYWNGPSVQEQLGHTVTPPQDAEWDRLQRDWDKFEATAVGLRPMSNYQFQVNNPYLSGDASTRHHAMHSQQGGISIYESVLEMEAVVQRDPTNAQAWFHLGVKQQENERESKAIHALRRALELDPTHLPSWVALAISHTNEGNRNGSYEAIREWINHNAQYREAVTAYRMQHPERDNMTQSEKFNDLIDCLITMSQTPGVEEIDADIQIALAVLMNTNEAYDRAKDCFLVALAMRPDDWQLYNRVGATLANSGQASDALEYYYRALELNPSYIRARFNLGISCINLRRYQEASQHILDALALQETDSVREHPDHDDKRGVTTSALWDSLKTCCLHLRRLDLATICDRRDLDAFQLNYQLSA